MIIRRQGPGDVTGARAVQVAAFGQAGTDAAEPIEAPLLDALRACDGWIPELSWVAEVEDEIVGHVVSTRGFVGDRPAVGLGPIGVLPDHQGRGVGLALMHASIGAADALGEPLIALLGDPGYYRRFGFVESSTVGIDPPDPAWGEHFQVLRLSAWSDHITGTFRYAAPFDDLD